MNLRTTVRLPPALLAKAKRKAAADGRTLTDLIEEGLHRVLDTSNKPAKRRVNLPVCRVSKQSKGKFVLPKMSELQEAEDIEYAARIRAGF